MGEDRHDILHVFIAGWQGPASVNDQCPFKMQLYGTSEWCTALDKSENNIFPDLPQIYVHTLHTYVRTTLCHCIKYPLKGEIRMYT